MVKTVKVNGIERTVLNAYCSGPGGKPHTYELKGHRPIEEFCGEWFVKSEGSWNPRLSGFARKVSLEVEPFKEWSSRMASVFGMIGMIRKERL